MIPKENIEDVINFCYTNNMDYLGKRIDMYELIYLEKYKTSTKEEIFNEWKNVYRASWDK